MANSNIYSISCLLLMLTLSWRTSTGHPVRADTLSADKCAKCSSLFKDLLVNITKLLKSEDLWFGISSDAVVVHSETETLLTCVPTLTQNTGCTMPINSAFSESECLKNIMKDLAHYEVAIQSYLGHPLRSPENETKLLSPTLEIIKSLRKNCSQNGENGESHPSEGTAGLPWGQDSFNNRQEMYKILKGFYIRTITINRAMGYISSGDHKK